VERIPHAIDIDVPLSGNRDEFGLPNNRFLFLSMYDTHSLQDRKNPQAVVDAFKKSFRRDDTSVGLVIKVNNAQTNPHEMERIKEKIAGYRNIYLIDQTLERIQVYNLLLATDCFVSLHRSEGFGLALAEAMFLGKPVIATNWSGNTDFMNHDNSCPVDYSLSTIGRDIGPYHAHQIWAEPDIGHASFYMSRLVNDRNWYNEIAAKGQQTIRTDYSPSVIGAMVKQRLINLGLF
jgi:glycosyltransferase involved in cell wall biosynthesis